MPAVQETIERVRRIDVDQYKYGFVTDIESDKAPKGLSEDIVRFISGKKNEPEWMLAWRLDAYRRWLTMREPNWARVQYGPIDYQDLYYYSAPKKKAGPKSLDEIDPEILKTYEKLGIPLREQKILAGVVEPKGDGEDAQHHAVLGPRHEGRNRGDRLRSGGGRGVLGRRLLLGQGRAVPCAGRHGRCAGPGPGRNSGKSRLCNL